MTDFQAWEQQLQQSLEQVRRNGQQLAEAAVAIRGRGETQGVFVELDAKGDITALQIAPAAMRWSSAQLTSALLDCHRKARAEVKSKVDRLIAAADPRIKEQVEQVHPAADEHGTERSAMTDEEIAAADDAYFERRNRYGGWAGG
jgi:DNA-binding protein YbaB